MATGMAESRGAFPRLGGGAWLWLAVLANVAGASMRPSRFLLISSPRQRNIYYAQLPFIRELAKPRKDRRPVMASTLINGENSKCTILCDENSNKGLVQPQGLALHQSNGYSTLYVSDFDSEVDESNIYSYSVSVSEVAVGALTVGEQRRVIRSVPGQVGWLAVDSFGNLFFSASKAGQIEMVTKANLTDGGEVNSTVLYGPAGTPPQVKGPAGLAADNFYVYWANKDGDASSGTVVRAPERAEALESFPPAPLASSSDLYEALAQNVCLARDNLFFTGETKSLFATKTGGGTMAEISHDFNAPRGCAYDLESSLYVADELESGVFSLPANMGTLRPVKSKWKVVSVPEPDQIAVMIG